MRAIKIMQGMTAISVSMLLAACSQMGLASGPACQGEFRFDGISGEPLRRDARRTILQFVALDETVEAANPAATEREPLLITGRGRHCDDFGRSFLASRMREFQGLSYRRLR